jgi:very-short-patch-repair endonuclease
MKMASSDPPKANAIPKALPLNGGGLGGGVPTGLPGMFEDGAGEGRRFDHDSHRPGAVGRARHLRREATVSEKNLWEALRKLKLNIRRQPPMGRYTADFIHHASRLVIEVDGPSHSLPEAQLHDLQRDAWFASQGYRVHRVSDRDAFGRPWDIAQDVERLIQASNKSAGARQSSSGRLVDTPPSPTLPPLRGKGE